MLLKLKILVVVVTAAFIANAYYDGNLVSYLRVNGKYIQMATYGLIGVMVLYFMKQDPAKSHSFLQNATQFVKHLPIDTQAGDFVEPMMDITRSVMTSSNTSYNDMNVSRPVGGNIPRSERAVPTGFKKRAVSESKKKYVASHQGWRCGHCKQQLDHTFEVDHDVELQFGGTNDVSNLVALCRNCHGKKTAHNRIFS